MTREIPKSAEPVPPTESSDAELRAKVAELESRLEDALRLKHEVEWQAELISRLEDALRLKREVESQQELIRGLTGQLQREIDRNKELGNQLTAFYSTLTYRTKVAAYRQLKPILDRWKRR